MLKKILFITRNQKGFTLVETLIAVAIVAIIGSVIATTLVQVITVQAADSNRTEAYKQVENALHYINRDAQMSAWLDGQSTPGYFPITLHWDEFDAVTSQFVDLAVTYSIVDNKLVRSQLKSGTTTVTMIASHIDTTGTLTTCSLNANRTLAVQITASVVGYKSATETRAIEVTLRPTVIR